MKYLAVLFVLFPMLVFAGGAVNCNDVPNSQCKNSCQKDEYIITKVRVMSGNHKGEDVSVLCNKEKIDPSKVCCTKEKK